MTCRVARAAAIRWTIAAAGCLAALGCEGATPGKKALPGSGAPAGDGGGVEETFRIVATENGFEAPDWVTPGLRHIVFENRGTQIHEAMVVKLAAGMTAETYVEAVRGGSLFPAGALDYSGPGLTSPGEIVELWDRLDPGEYILICWNRDHARTVPVHPFSVEGTPRDDAEPKADAVLKLVNYRFELEGPLHKGVRILRIETPGPAMHELDLFRLHSGKTAADLLAWLDQDEEGPAPADALGGALDNHDVSRVTWLRAELTPGRYVLHCEMPVTTEADAVAAAAGKTHTDLGMVQEIEVAD